jgi:hypothetical protein
LLLELSGLNLSDSRIWQLSQAAGKCLEQNCRAEVIRQFESDYIKPPLEPRTTVGKKDRPGVGMDGVMVHIRGEGYKETKLGCLFELETNFTKEGESQVAARTQSYSFYLGGPEEFGQRLWLEAERREWEQAAGREVVGDGASWIWNLAAEHFRGEVEIVDWYHAKQHLWNGANLLYGEGSLKARQWVEIYSDLLYEGKTEAVGKGLEQSLKGLKAPVSEEKTELIKREVNYFRHNQARMQYAKRREEGWAIGSGVVEGGCKQFKQRFGGSGMRWSREGASNLMPLRAAVMGARFDQLWHSLCTQN